MGDAFVGNLWDCLLGLSVLLAWPMLIFGTPIIVLGTLHNRSQQRLKAHARQLSATKRPLEDGNPFRSPEV